MSIGGVTRQQSRPSGHCRTDDEERRARGSRRKDQTHTNRLRRARRDLPSWWIMPKESGYFEEAMALRHDGDPLVGAIVDALYERMLANRNTHVPREGFSILYFFQASIQAWLDVHPAITLRSTHYPQPCPSIRAVNWPSEIRGALLGRFVEVVRVDSAPRGGEFDVTYAAAIITSTFDMNGELMQPDSQVGDADSMFDEWLSGFNTPE